jgi:hypothetical protein
VTALTCGQISEALAGASEVYCHQLEDSLLVVSPLMLGDGDHVQVLVRQLPNGRLQVDDFGTVVGRLRDRGLEPDDGMLRDQISEVAKMHGADVVDDTLTVDVEGFDELLDGYLRLSAAVVQADVLHVAARDAATAFSRRVVDYLEMSTGGPIVRRTKNVKHHGRNYRLNAALYRSAGELEREDATLMHTAANRSTLEHCWYMFSDLAAPSWRKLTVITDRQLERNRPHVDRLRQVATVASFDSREALLQWTMASDETRQEMPSLVGTFQQDLDD